MLVEVDKNELGDKRLNPEEAVCRERESLLQKAGHYRIDGQDELEDPERACGPRLQYTEVISRIKREAPSLKVVEGSPGSVALYFPRTAKDLEHTIREWDWEHDNKRDPFFRHHRYVGGFPKQEMAEYSTVDVDTSMLPTREKRGWRSVLMALVKQGCLSYAQAVRAFGEVGSDKRGWRWNQQLHPWKSNPNRAFKFETQELQDNR
jgi:hypothetical protein